METYRKQAPAAVTDFLFHFMEPEVVTLSNGTVLYFISGGSQEISKIECIFPGGNYFEDRHLVASTVNELIGEGTSVHTGKEIADLLDIYGSYLQKETTRDHGIVALFSLNKYLLQVLPVFMESLEDSNFPEDEIELNLKNRKARFESNLQKVEFACRNEFGKFLFGNHAYGAPTSVDDYDAVNKKHLHAFYDHQYKGVAPLVFVSGLISDAVKKSIADAFGQLSFSGISIPGTVLPADLPAPATRHDDWGENAMQSAVRMGKRTIMPDHEDYPALSLLNIIFGGYYGSRLMQNIRQDKGYTYGIYSGVTALQYAGMQVISGEVGKSVREAAVTEIYKELERLSADEVPQQELEMGRNYMLGNFLKSLDGPMAQADRIRVRVLRGYGKDYYREYLEKIKSLQPIDLQRCAQQYMQPSSYSLLTVG